MVDVQLYIDADTTPVNQRQAAYIWDDFHGVGGDLRWTLAGNSPAIVDGQQSGDPPGYTKMSTDGTSGHEAVLTLTGFTPHYLQSAEMIFGRLDTTAVLYRIGFFNTAAFASVANGFGVEFDTVGGDTALSLVKWISGVRTVITTLPINGTHLYRLNWSRSDDASGSLVLTDVTASTSATASVTALAGANSWYGGFYVKQTTGTVRNISIDWFLAALALMTR